MRRMTAMAIALLVPALLAGCDLDDDDLTGVDDDLVGTFEATEFGFAATETADVVDFDDLGATFTLQLSPDRTFTSTFVEAPGAAPLVRTGPFTVTGDEILLGERALFVDVEDAPQRFTFTRLGNRLTLDSVEPMLVDFDNDGIFETTETALFEADLTLF